MKPNFKNIDYKTARYAGASPEAASLWQTPEQIPVKPVYTAADLEGMEHLNYAAGIAPNLRGPY
ncbi:MAG: hypothetical protein LBS09_07265, partial [Bacteroidales bacterium]|nr:hypothetical protein [Bacteroidales bacterium]